MKKISVIFTVIMLAVVLCVSASAKTVKLGDVNGDGKVNALDARAILRYSAKLDTPTDEQAIIADVDLSGKVNALDARKVLRAAARLESDLGEITIDDDTQESTTAESTEAIEVKNGIGMTVKNFISQYGGMTKVGTSDGSTMYQNNDLIIVSDPKMIDDLKINSITVTGEKYTLNGITVNMTASDARKTLVLADWTLKTDSDSTVVYAKQSDLMKLTVKNGIVTQVELCLAFSIATEVPTETTTQEPTTSGGTTQEPTTQEPATDEPTTQEPATQPDDSNDNDNLPADVKAFLSGNFGFSGTIYNMENSVTNDVTLYTDGKNVSMVMEAVLDDGSSMKLGVIIPDGSDNIYLTYPAGKIYVKTSPEELASMINSSADSFRFNVNMGVGGSNVNLNTKTVTEDGTEYIVYYADTDNGETLIYTVNDEIVRVEMRNTDGTVKTRIDIDEFYDSFSSDVFSYSKYTNTLTLTIFFISLGFQMV